MAEREVITVPSDDDDEIQVLRVKKPERRRGAQPGTSAGASNSTNSSAPVGRAHPGKAPRSGKRGIEDDDESEPEGEHSTEDSPRKSKAFRRDLSVRPDKYRTAREKLHLIVHAGECRLSKCPRGGCARTKKMCEHVLECEDDACRVNYCEETTLLLHHSRSCFPQETVCPLCLRKPPVEGEDLLSKLPVDMLRLIVRKYVRKRSDLASLERVNRRLYSFLNDPSERTALSRKECKLLCITQNKEEFSFDFTVSIAVPPAPRARQRITRVVERVVFLYKLSRNSEADVKEQFLKNPKAADKTVHDSSSPPSAVPDHFIAHLSRSFNMLSFQKLELRGIILNNALISALVSASGKREESGEKKDATSIDAPLAADLDRELMVKFFNAYVIRNSSMAESAGNCVVS